MERTREWLAKRKYSPTGVSPEVEAAPPHAHHAGPKSNDSTAIPLCLKHHDEWHSANGWTKHLVKDARRAWAESAIAVTRVMLGWGAEHTAATTGDAK